LSDNSNQLPSPQHPITTYNGALLTFIFIKTQHQVVCEQHRQSRLEKKQRLSQYGSNDTTEQPKMFPHQSIPKCQDIPEQESHLRGGRIAINNNQLL
jgi:hypothetical protein